MNRRIDITSVGTSPAWEKIFEYNRFIFLYIYTFDNAEIYHSS